MNSSYLCLDCALKFLIWKKTFAHWAFKSLPARRDLVLCVSARIAKEEWLLCTRIPLPVLPVATCGNNWWCALATCGSPDKSYEPTASRAMSVTSLPSHSRVAVVHRIHVADSHLQALSEVSQRSVGTKTTWLQQVDGTFRWRIPGTVLLSSSDFGITNP